MSVYPAVVELLAIGLFAGCVWHATRVAGRAFAQQWFIPLYLVALIRETINQAALQTYSYAPGILRVGAAPALVALLPASIFYLAYQFARRLGAERPAGIASVMFLSALSLALPLEATAAQALWWVYAEPRLVVFGRVPVAAPLVWGGAAVIWYAVWARVARTRLPERGRLYALITLSPIIALAQLLLALALGG